MHYKYSVIIPVYNAEKYLGECIDSVLNQKYQDFEIMLVNDGSTDSSGDICDMYMKRDNRVKVYHQNNQGHIVARQKAIALATGDIYLFLDSDDFWDSDLLQTVNATFNEFNCDMVIFNFKRIVNESVIEQKGLFKDKQIFSEGNKHILFEKIINSNDLNSLCIKAVKSSIVYDGIDFSTYNIKHAEDLLLSLPLLYKASKTVYIDKALYNYRMNPQSISNTPNIYKFRDISIVRGKLLEYLKLLGYADDSNIRQFNRFYCKIMADCILTLINLNIEKYNKIKLLKEMYEIPLFVNALNSVKTSYFSPKYIPILCLFKNEYYNLLFIYGNIYKIMQKTKHKIIKRYQ